MNGCPRCTDLERRIRQMEAERRRDRGVEIISALATRLNLTEQPARILAALYQANGRVLGRDFLLDEVLPVARVEVRGGKCLDVLIWNIRRTAGFSAIQTHPGLGYSITDLGRLICDEALETRARAA